MNFQRDMERDQNNHVDNIHDEKLDHKIGRDFRNLGPHAGMVHLHSGIEHLNNVDVEVGFSYPYKFIPSYISFDYICVTYLCYICMLFR